jgi:hypothetical protein
VRSVRRCDVFRALHECKQQVKPAFCLNSPFSDGEPAIRLNSSNFPKSTNAGGR